jgi:hypothetical protein
VELKEDAHSGTDEELSNFDILLASSIHVHIGEMLATTVVGKKR